MYLRVIDDTDVARLQQAVGALINWANTWHLSISINKCCILNLGKVIFNTSIDINGVALPAVEHSTYTRLGSCNDLWSVSVIACQRNCCQRTHNKRAALIHRAFVSRDVKVYVRPLLEFSSIIWSPYTGKDITAIESVQRSFTKPLPFRTVILSRPIAASQHS